MPYVQESDRPYVVIYGVRGSMSAGQLAYVLFVLGKDYIQRSFSYARMAVFTGVMLLTLLELWRRIIVPHENRKLKENGDVMEDTIQTHRTRS